MRHIDGFSHGFANMEEWAVGHLSALLSVVVLALTPFDLTFGNQEV